MKEYWNIGTFANLRVNGERFYERIPHELPVGGQVETSKTS